MKPSEGRLFSAVSAYLICIRRCRFSCAEKHNADAFCFFALGVPNFCRNADAFLQKGTVSVPMRWRTRETRGTRGTGMRRLMFRRASPSVAVTLVMSAASLRRMNPAVRCGCSCVPLARGFVFFSFLRLVGRVCVCRSRWLAGAAVFVCITHS